MDCLDWYEENELPDLNHDYIKKLQIGTLIKALGSLQFPPDTTLTGNQAVRRYTKVRQLVLTAPVQIQNDINEQFKHWNECIHLWDNFYSKKEFYSNIENKNQKEEEEENKNKKQPLTEEEKLCEVIYQAILKSPPMPYLKDEFKTIVDFTLKNHCFDVNTLCTKDISVKNFLTQSLVVDKEKLLKDSLTILIKQGKIYEYSITVEKERIYCLLTYAELIAPQVFKFICNEVNSSEEETVNEKKVLSYFQVDSGDYR